MVRNDHGAEVANRLARRLVAGPHRDGGQAQYIEQPVPDTSGQRLGPVLSWALQHLADKPTIGGALGLAIFSAIATGRTHHLLTAGAPLPTALTAGFQAALLACAIFLAAAAVIATRAAGTRQQLTAVVQPAPGPESMAKAA